MSEFREALVNLLARELDCPPEELREEDVLRFHPESFAVLFGDGGLLSGPAVTVSARGFKQVEPIAGTYGEKVAIYESSMAFDPHIWINVEQPNNRNNWGMGDESDGTTEVTAHLSAEAAWQLHEQLNWLLKHHYYGDIRPFGKYWTEDDD